MRPEGAHIFQASVLNTKKDTLYLVCASCIPDKNDLLGLPVLRQSAKGFSSSSIFDLTDGNQVSRLLPFLSCKGRLLEGDRMLVNRSLDIDVSGLQLVQPETTRINITTQKIKPKKRTLVARAIRDISFKTNMAFSGEERRNVLHAIDLENESKRKRTEPNTPFIEEPPVKRITDIFEPNSTPFIEEPPVKRTYRPY